jgi:hypothetical protein
VWGTSSEEDNVTWGCAGEDEAPFDDPESPTIYENVNFDDLFGSSEPLPEPIEPTAPLAIVPETTETTTVLAPVTTILGGGF